MKLCTYKMHICPGDLTIIGSNNGLSPGWRQAIFWTNAGILLIGPIRANFSEILIGIDTFSSKKMHLKTSSAKCRLICLGLNVLNAYIRFVRCYALLWSAQVDVSFIQWCPHLRVHIDGLVQDCSISSALAMEILQSCIKPSIYT